VPGPRHTEEIVFRPTAAAEGDVFGRAGVMANRCFTLHPRTSRWSDRQTLIDGT